MTDRIDKYLDGEIERIALRPDERAQAEALERAIEETRAFVEARPAPDLTLGVMRHIDQLGLRPAKPGLLKRVADTLWTSHRISFPFRPAYAVVTAAAIAALMVLSPGTLRSPIDTAPFATPTSEPKLFVQFRLQAADAMNVRLAGSFTNWQPQYDLHETAPGIWTITLPLSVGVHDYVFVVDGRHWVPDPYAPRVDDGFGGTNSRIALLPPDTPRS